MTWKVPEVRRQYSVYKTEECSSWTRHQRIWPDPRTPPWTQTSMLGSQLAAWHVVIPFWHQSNRTALQSGLTHKGSSCCWPHTWGPVWAQSWRSRRWAGDLCHLETFAISLLHWDVLSRPVFLPYSTSHSQCPACIRPPINNVEEKMNCMSTFSRNILHNGEFRKGTADIDTEK